MGAGRDGCKRRAGVMIAEADIRAVLNEIVDPCSAAAGNAAGLGDMGLIREVRLDREGAGTNVFVSIGVTHPMCLMAGVFLNEARTRLGKIRGVGKLTVELDSGHVWTPDDLSPDYRARLEAARSAAAPVKRKVESSSS